MIGIITILCSLPSLIADTAGSLGKPKTAEETKVRSANDPCPYCGSTKVQPIGPGNLVRDDFPTTLRSEIGDEDRIFRCDECAGKFGQISDRGKTLRIYKIQGEKISVGALPFSV